MLGFESSIAIIHKEAAFNAGSGPIWINSIVCNGNEGNLRECKSADWSPSFQCKHVEDVGVECIPINQLEKYVPYFVKKCPGTLSKHAI